MRPLALPPQDLEAEQACLGAILLEAGAAKAGLAIVQPDDFYREAHKSIARAAAKLHAEGIAPDVITVTSALRDMGQLDEGGGVEYLTALLGEVPYTGHVRRYAQIVVDKAMLRRLIAHGDELAEFCYACEGSPDELLAWGTNSLRVLAEERVGKEGAKPLSEVGERSAATVLAALDQPAGLYGARTGIEPLDTIAGGLADWRLWLFLAYRGEGKSRFALQTVLTSARHFLQTAQWVLVYMLEGDLGHWTRRALAWLGDIDGDLLRPGRARDLWPEERKALQGAREELPTLPVSVADRLRDVDGIVTDAEVQATQHKVGLVVVDYAQAVGVRGVSKPMEAVTITAQRLSQLSDDLRCPVLLTSQVTFTEGGDVRSRWAQDAENPASHVLWFRRSPKGEDLNSADRQCCPEGQVICTKSREGRPFEVAVKLDLSRSRFYGERQWEQLQATRRARVT